jgi:glycosyltransferase involved in cell wall biosynthesis
MSKRTIALISYDLEPVSGGQGKHFEQLGWELEKRLPGDCWNIIKISQKYLQERGGLGSKLLKKVKQPFLRYIFFIFYLNFILPSEIKRNKIALAILNCGPGGVVLFFRISCTLLSIANHTYAQQIRFLPQQSWKRILQMLESKTYKLSDTIFSISSSTAESLKTDYHIPENKIEIVHIGSKASNADLGLDAIPRKSLLFVGRLDDRKGIKFLLESALFLQKLLPDFVLNIVGKGPLFDQANTFISNNGLSNFVRLMGHVSDQHLQELYAQTAIFVAPSVFEGLGLAALDAAAQGIPIVARAVPGLTDVVIHERNGFLTDSNSPSEFAEACLKLASNSELRKQMGEAGRQYVQKYFNWNLIIQSYLGRITRL